MSSSKEVVRGMKELPEISWQPRLKHPSLIVGWSVDASTLGAKVTDYLIRKLGGRSFCELDPVEFFPLGGVSIDDNVVRFPESKFYACPEHDLVILKSTPPSYEWYKFFNLVLDVAEHNCKVKELYTTGGMVALSAHTVPREIMGTFNSPEMKSTLSHYDLGGGMNYETPPGQRPTLNSFFMWVARQRNIPGVTIWAPVPFYLVTVDDPATQRRVLEFFNQRFGLGVDFRDLDEEVRRQNQKLAEMRNSFPDIDESIKRVETNLRLSAEETQSLIKGVEDFLRERKE